MAAEAGELAEDAESDVCGPTELPPADVAIHSVFKLLAAPRDGDVV